MNESEALKEQMDSDSILTFEEKQSEDKAFSGWISALRSQEVNSTIELAG